MKPIYWLLTGIVVGAAGWYYYERSKNNEPIINDAFFNNKGYTSMMKMDPRYYNITSMEGVTSNPAAPSAIADTWALGAEQGNAMMVSAGWTDYPDSYSATVSNSWLQEEAQGAHL